MRLCRPLGTIYAIPPWSTSPASRPPVSWPTRSHGVPSFPGAHQVSASVAGPASGVRAGGVGLVAGRRRLLGAGGGQKTHGFGTPCLQSTKRDLVLEAPAPTINPGLTPGLDLHYPGCYHPLFLDRDIAAQSRLVSETAYLGEHEFRTVFDNEDGFLRAVVAAMLAPRVNTSH